MNICWCSDKGRVLRCQEFSGSLPCVPPQPSLCTQCVRGFVCTQHTSIPSYCSWLTPSPEAWEYVEPPPLTEAARCFQPGFFPTLKICVFSLGPFHGLMVRPTCRTVRRMCLGAHRCGGGPWSWRCYSDWDLPALWVCARTRMCGNHDELFLASIYWALTLGHTLCWVFYVYHLI